MFLWRLWFILLPEAWWIYIFLQLLRWLESGWSCNGGFNEVTTFLHNGMFLYLVRNAENLDKMLFATLSEMCVWHWNNWRTSSSPSLATQQTPSNLYTSFVHYYQQSGHLACTMFLCLILTCCQVLFYIIFILCELNPDWFIISQIYQYQSKNFLPNI